MNKTVRKFASWQVNKLKALTCRRFNVQTCKRLVVTGLLLGLLFGPLFQSADFRPPQGGPTTAQIIQEMVAAVERALGEDLSSLFRLVSQERAIFNWPLFGEITSGFGPRRHPITRERDFHEGIDLKADEGTAVYAARAGKVSFAGPKGGYGYLIILDHGLYETYYAHLSEILVYKGQFVEAGRLIARSGNTGFSTGPHLHFEIRLRGIPVNPLDYLP